MIKVIIGFSVNIILIRLVDPHSFGLLAMGTIVSGFLALFISLGSGSSLIFYVEINSRILSSVFWLNIFSGFLAGLILGLSGDLIVQFYQESQLKAICWLLGFGLFLQSMAITPYSILQKRLAFKRIYFADIVSIVLAGFCSITLAYMGWGVFSLLSNVIIYYFIRGIVLFFLSNWKPEFCFSFSSLRPHLNYGFPLVIENILGFTVRNIDDLLIGKWLGASALGIYNRSYAVLLFPLNNFVRVIGSVLFPAFSLINKDITRVKENFLKSCRIISATVFPAMAILFLIADEVIPLLMGRNWGEAVSLIRIFAVLAAFQSIGSLTGVVFQSMGATKLQMKVGFVVKPFLIAMIATGLWITRSIEGVALFYTIASVIAVPELYYSGKLIGTSLKEVGLAIARPVFISFCCALIIGHLNNSIFLFENLWFRMISKVAEYMVLYLGAFRLIASGHWRELSSIWFMIIKQR